MSFHHLAGVTTPGAPDEIADWFATFQAWITATVGWIIASGSGTTDLVIWSPGEVGGLTMLFVHIWRGAGANIDRVYMEVQDDAVGTHATTNDAYVDSGGVQFNSWMSADLDAISIFWKIGAGYRWKYAGLIYPFALTVPDETYHMISASMVRSTAAILRNHTGAWDFNAILYDHPRLDDALIDRFDGSYMLCGVYFNTGVNIGGQLKHVSGEVGDPAVNPEDTITSGLAGATTDWIVLSESMPIKMAMRTGGVLPTGYPDGANFAHQTGVAPDIANFLTVIIPTFLTGIGWTDHGEQSLPNSDYSRLFESAGEDGNDEIFIGWSHQHAINTGLYGFVQDDLAGTHRSFGDRLTMVAGDFPTNYFITADRDCFMLTIQRGIAYDRLWLGMVQAFAPGLYAPGNTPYKMIRMHMRGPTQGIKMLREHGGGWVPGSNLSFVMAESASNPNAFDGVTYLLWPVPVSLGIGADFEPIGVMRYQFGTQGGGIASLDTITVGAQVYTVFFDSNNDPWAMRTA